jgi:hypothetical protein
MNVDITFLSNLILGNDVQVSETLVQKGGDIVSLLQNLGINVIIYKR